MGIPRSEAHLQGSDNLRKKRMDRQPEKTGTGNEHTFSQHGCWSGLKFLSRNKKRKGKERSVKEFERSGSQPKGGGVVG